MFRCNVINPKCYYILWMFGHVLTWGCESQEQTPSTAAVGPQVNSPPDTELPDTPITVPIAKEPHPWDTPKNLLLFVAKHQWSDKEQSQALEKIALFDTPNRQAKQPAPQIRFFTAPVNLKLDLARLSRQLAIKGKNTEAFQMALLIPERDDQPNWMNRLKSSPVPNGKKNQTRDFIRRLADSAEKTGGDLIIESSRTIEDPEERDAVLSRLVPYLVDQDNIDTALKLIEEMQSADSQTEALDVIARKQIKENQLEAAIRLVDRMQPAEEALRIKIVLVFDIVNHLMQSGDLERALQLAKTVKDPEQQNSVLETIVLKLIEQHQFQKALELCQQVKNHEYDPAKDNCFDQLITELVAAGQLDQAIKAFPLIKADSLSKLFVIDDLIKSLMATQEREQVLQVAQMFETAKERRTARGAVSEYLAQHHQFQQALEVAESIEASYEKQNALSEIIEQRLQCGQLELIVTLLQKHKDSDPLAVSFESFMYHDANHQWHRSVPLYQQLITAFVAAQKPDQAYKISQTLLDEDKKLSATQFLIEALVETGSYEKACDLAINYQTDEYSQSDLQLTAANSLVAVGQYPLALKLAEQLQDNDLRQQVKYQRVMQLARKGELEQAQELAATLHHFKWKPEAQLELVYALIEKRELDGAIRITKKIEHATLKPKAEESLINALLESNRTQQAGEIACDIWNPRLRNSELFKVAEQLATKPVLGENNFQSFSSGNRKLKTKFTPEEQKLARRIVVTIDAD